jgi:hypothetical protein
MLGTAIPALMFERTTRPLLRLFIVVPFREPTPTLSIFVPRWGAVNGRATKT